MKTIVLIILMLIPLLTSVGQTAGKSFNYSAQYDSLSRLKTELISAKNKLRLEIDSLTEYSAHLDSLLEKCRPVIFIRKYGKKIGWRIAMRKIWKGMTRQMLKDSWGKPDKITSRKYSYGRFTQYYYGKIIFFFKNGRLIDWEERKR